MKFDIKLKMDNKTFWFCVIIIVLLTIVSLNFNNTPIVIERYNCSCPEEKSFYKDIGWKSFETKQSEIDIPNFEEDCEEVTCDCYKEFGCMAKCYRCNSSDY